MATSAASVAITSSRKASFQLEFVDSSGVTWDLIARTIDFVDQLLEKHLRTLIFNQRYEDDVAYPNDMGIYSVQSRIQEACGKDLPNQDAANFFCATMETTISTVEYSNQGALNSPNFMDFWMTDALKDYMLNQMYPLVLQSLRLTYLEPQWVSIDSLGFYLIGAIPSEMDPTAQDIFRGAVVDFVSTGITNETRQSSSMLSTLRGSDLAIRHQDMLADSPIIMEDGEEHVGQKYNEALQVQVTLFRKLAGVDLVNNTDLLAAHYSEAVLSHFQRHSEQFVHHYLSTGFSDDFFTNVHTIQTLLMEDSLTPAPSTPSPTATEPPETTPFDSFYKKPDSSLKFKSVAASVALLPVMVLAIAIVFIFLSNRRKRTQKMIIIQHLEEKL